MEYEIETVYYLENPETEQITFATGSQLRYEDIIKDVFGVASMNDLPMMIQYNKNFQSSICRSHGIQENEITLEMILRVASKIDLQQLKKQYVDKAGNEQSAADNEPIFIPCPFESVIRLQEGIFKWDEQNFSYRQLITN